MSIDVFVQHCDICLKVCVYKSPYLRTYSINKVLSHKTLFDTSQFTDVQG